eukprot:gene5706-9526_t
MTLEKKKESRLIIVSNRLPITLQKVDGTISFKKSSGGLVTAINGMERPFSWIGWLGNEIPKEQEKQKIEKMLSNEKNPLFPVFMEEKIGKLFYGGFSNSILWPLFHYQFERTVKFFGDMKEQWIAYQQANQCFVDKILEVYKKGDMVWVHDYQLMLVPKLLREKIPDINIGFFLHIPFPSSEIYKILPVHKEILDGVLNSNLVGFHTYDFARHFLSACTRGFGTSPTPLGILHKHTFVSVGTFPIGINPQQFTDGTKKQETFDLFKSFKQKYDGKKIIIGVDRVDYTKGITLKLEAYKKFLQKNPGKTVLIQVGVPSREDIDEYRSLINEVNRLVGEINSLYGTLDYSPIVYINKSINFSELCALYALGDCLIVSSVRDGMNLVACEYVVCQNERKNLGGDDQGVLILSEFAGASRSLAGSVIINPWDEDGVAAKIEHCLFQMSTTEKLERHKQNFEIVSTNSVKKWASTFMSEFEKSCDTSREVYHEISILPKLSVDIMRENMNNSKKRSFILDYDGTLVDITNHPRFAFPKKELIEILKKIVSNDKNDVTILTGRTKEPMELFLEEVKNDIRICTEHGMLTKDQNSKDWYSLYENGSDMKWKDILKPVLDHFSQRTPGSFVEDNTNSLVFHYRNVEPEYGKYQANELILHIEHTFGSLPVDIISGKKIIEFRSLGVSKGHATEKLISKLKPDFVLVVGDDKTDEETFEALNNLQAKTTDFKSISAVVGNPKGNITSRAHYRLASPADLLDILKQIADK